MLKIGMISGHGCIRVYKEAAPLIEAGHKVYLASLGLAHYHEKFENFLFCEDGKRPLANAIGLLDKEVDIFHVHNEPSWLVQLVKENSNKPIVLDVHDSYLARSTPEQDAERKDQGVVNLRISTEERNNFKLADGLVFPSATFGKLIRDEFKLDQPCVIIESRVPKSLYRYNTGEWLGGLVYEGKINHPSDVSHGFDYCEYSKLSKKAEKLGMDFHIYAGKEGEDRYEKAYGSTSYHYKAFDFFNLLKAISRHDWGLVGNLTPTTEWEYALPNKLFEYIATNVPIVAINADAAAKFILEYGIGIKVDSLGELAARWPEHVECRKKLMKIRMGFAMEYRMPYLLDLYEGLL